MKNKLGEGNEANICSLCKLYNINLDDRYGITYSDVFIYVHERRLIFS